MTDINTRIAKLEIDCENIKECVDKNFNVYCPERIRNMISDAIKEAAKEATQTHQSSTMIALAKWGAVITVVNGIAGFIAAYLR